MRPQTLTLIPIQVRPQNFVAGERSWAVEDRRGTDTVDFERDKAVRCLCAGVLRAGCRYLPLLTATAGREPAPQRTQRSTPAS